MKISFNPRLVEIESNVIKLNIINLFFGGIKKNIPSNKINEVIKKNENFLLVLRLIQFYFIISFMIFLIILGVFFQIVFLIKPFLNPFDQFYFDYHDITQPARLSQFFLNLIHLKIPPRIAPDFLFGLSYSVFNFYAQFSYWITSIFLFLGLNPAQSIEASFVLALILGFVGSFLLFEKYFDKWSAFLSASIYSTSPYLAVEIFTRGNLGEVWFWALLPWVFYFLKTKRTILSLISMHALFTVHNIFSLFAIPIVLVFILFQKNRRKKILLFLFSLLTTAYFWLPFFAEMSLVQAKDIAVQTKYQEHFLCLKQIWDAGGWYFGGSGPGCKDYMSFMLGKGQIILGSLGFLAFLFFKKYKAKEYLFFSVLTFVSLFLTINISYPVWKIFEPILKIVQFPWRFLLIFLFGVAFFSNFLVLFFGKRKIFKTIVVFLFVFLLFFLNKKFFFKPLKNESEFFEKYLSEKAVKTDMAFRIPEYIYVKTDYEFLKKYRNKEVEFPVVEGEKIRVLKEKKDLFQKQVVVYVPRKAQVFLGIHYFPVWRIYVNNKEVAPVDFDKFGRPLITLSEGKQEILIKYKQTFTEQVGNLLTIISFGLALIFIRVKVL